ncbi:MAG: hypothetical protein Q8P41_14395 [Pseudomonadota bacterium]|nr:hypothetical protein [Pseudomonadota bacterium]
MRRTLRPGLLVTVSMGAAVAACANPFGGDAEEDRPPTHNPPALPPPVVAATFPTGPVRAGELANPLDPEGRAIYRGGVAGDCYVELPFVERPTSVRRPPTQEVACPAPMMEEAWTGCLGGILEVAKVDPLECVCDFFGNPPPPPKAAVCPREVLARLPQPGAAGMPGAGAPGIPEAGAAGSR